MRNYFNKKEQLEHLAILACQGKGQELAKNEALTKEEQRYLKKGSEWYEKFSKSIFERFGNAYQRKLLCTLDSNELLLVGKYAPKQETISMAAQEDIAPMFKKVQGMYCLTCNGEKHLDCAMYACAVALGVEAVGKDCTKCPYWVEEESNKFDEEDFDF